MSDNEKSIHMIDNRTRLLWIVMLITPIVFFMIARRLPEDRPLPSAETLQWIVVAAVILSMASIVSAFVIRKKLPRRMLKPPHPIFNSFMNLMLGKGDKDASPAALAAVTIMIILSSYAVSCSIYGFFLVFLGSDIRVMIPFMAVSLILLWIFRPTEAFVRRVEEKLNE